MNEWFCHSNIHFVWHSPFEIKIYSTETGNTIIPLKCQQLFAITVFIFRVFLRKVYRSGNHKFSLFVVHFLRKRTLNRIVSVLRGFFSFLPVVMNFAARNQIYDISTRLVSQSSHRQVEFHLPFYIFWLIQPSQRTTETTNY